MKSWTAAKIGRLCGPARCALCPAGSNGRLDSEAASKCPTEGQPPKRFLARVENDPCNQCESPLKENVHGFLANADIF
jgi:hypothetical protein